MLGVFGWCVRNNNVCGTELLVRLYRNFVRCYDNVCRKESEEHASGCGGGVHRMIRPPELKWIEINIFLWARRAYSSVTCASALHSVG